MGLSLHSPHVGLDRLSGGGTTFATIDFVTTPNSLSADAARATPELLTSTAERRRGWVVGATSALWFGVPMAIVALNEGTTNSAETTAWYSSIAVGIAVFGFLHGLWIRAVARPGDLWRLTALATVWCIVGLYIPFASSHACAAIGDPGGCYSSGAAAVMAGFAPLYFAFLGPVALGLLVRRRMARA